MKFSSNKISKKILKNNDKLHYNKFESYLSTIFSILFTFDLLNNKRKPIKKSDEKIKQKYHKMVVKYDGNKIIKKLDVINIEDDNFKQITISDASKMAIRKNNKTIFYNAIILCESMKEINDISIKLASDLEEICYENGIDGNIKSNNYLIAIKKITEKLNRFKY
jgi:hypothetical protein